MTACPRSGCSGTLDEDDFCDVCGLAAPPAAAVAEPATVGSARGSASQPTIATVWTSAISSPSCSRSAPGAQAGSRSCITWPAASPRGAARSS